MGKKKNGHAKTTRVTEKIKERPSSLSREDFLELQLVNEREGRILAQIAKLQDDGVRAQSQRMTFAATLRAKYGLNERDQITPDGLIVRGAGAPQEAPKSVSPAEVAEASGGAPAQPDGVKN